MKLWNYDHVSGYLNWAKAAFAFARVGGLVRINRHDDPVDFAEFRRKFLKALHNRINLKGGVDLYNVPNHRGQASRKFDSMYQTGLIRDCRRVREIVTTRLRVYQFETPEIRFRFGHLLASYED